jgi:hypothetical protein
MKSLSLLPIIFSLLLAASAYTQTSVSDSEIKQVLIQQSIMAYPGKCACPYQPASNGSRCGKRSAYSRIGGYEVLCYENDVTDDMVEQYRQFYR